MAAKVKTKYVCQNCGYCTSRWIGKCPDCDEWNTLIEEIIDKDKRTSNRSTSLLKQSANLKSISDINQTDSIRFKTVFRH